MRKPGFVIFIFVLTLFSLPLVFGRVYAAYFDFDKTSYTTSEGNTFTVDVTVNAGDDELKSADAYIQYDATYLEAESVDDGTYFPTVTNDISSGTVYITGLIDDPAVPSTGSGKLATITFKSLKATGSNNVTLKFNCGSGSSSSSISKNDDTGTNVIECSANGESTVTTGGGSTATATPVASPSALPKTGAVENVMRLAIPGMMLFMLGIAARMVL